MKRNIVNSSVLAGLLLISLSFWAVGSPSAKTQIPTSDNIIKVSKEVLPTVLSIKTTKKIGEIQYKPYRAMVIRSHQLGPGIGGYRPEQLFELLDRVERSKGPLLIGTACRCHGVITGLERVS